MLKRNKPHYEYIDGSRSYKTQWGIKPSVTTILRETGNQYMLHQWRDRIGHEEADRISRESIERGNRLHQDIENWVNTGELSDNPLFLVTYEHVLSELEVMCIETQIASPFGYAGTLDCIGIYKDKVTVIDWKTSSKPKEKSHTLDYRTQVAAYVNAVRWTYPGIAPTQGLICVLVEGCNEPQLFLMDEKELEKKWQRFLTRLKKYTELQQTS